MWPITKSPYKLCRISSLIDHRAPRTRMCAFAILNRNAIKQLLSFIDQSNVISLDSPAQVSATVRYDAALAKANELLSARVSGILLPECSLFNASYSVHYTFQYPNQTRRVSIDEWRNPVRLYDILNPSESRSPQGGEEAHETPDGSVVNPMVPFSARDAQVSSYGTVMQAFSTLLIGRSSNDRYNGDTTDHTSWKIIDIDWSDGSVVQRALEQPFQNITLSVLSDQSLM